MPVAICGDDKASVRPNSEVSKIHREIITSLEAKLSTKGKDADSRRVIFFCEDSVICHYNEPIGWTFTYVDVIKGRLLTTMAR